MEMVILSKKELKEMQRNLGKSETDFVFTRKDIENLYKKYDIITSKEFGDNIIKNKKRLIKFGELLQREGLINR